MKRQAWWLAVVFMVALFAPIATSAQQGEEKKEPPPPEFQFYKLSFTLRELEDGKVLNTRTYVTNMRSTTSRQSDSRASLRAGTRVPIVTVVRREDSTPSNPVESWQYQDIGVNIDCNMEAPTPSQPASALRIVVEISTLAPPADSGPQKAIQAPLIRQVRGSATVPFVLDKPTLVTSVDDVTSKRQYQLEVKITKM